MRKSLVIALSLAVTAVTPAFAEEAANAAHEIVGPPNVAAEQAAPEATEPAPAPAAPESAPLNLRPSPTLEVKPPSTGLGIGYKLAAVAAVFGGALLLFRRKQNVTFNVGASIKPRVVGRTSIGTRTEVVVIEVEGQRLVLGVTPSNVTTLSVLTEEPRLAPAEIEEPRAESFVRPAIVPPSPRTPRIEESLNRLIAGARAELEEQPARDRFERSERLERMERERPKHPVERVMERAERAERAERRTPAAPKSEVTPRSRQSRVREVTSLEGQVRGLTAKRG